MSNSPHLIEIKPDEMAVRHALLQAQSAWDGFGAGQNHRAKAEQVLAEVLNNIVEHAMAGRPGGQILLCTVMRNGAISCKTSDDGHPMPDNKLPCGTLAEHNNRLEELPEGGFGWFMIHELTSDLNYCREGNRNHLSFLVPPP